MTVFVSIATMGSRERLRECLRSLPAACDGLPYSVTVVDNCSTDGTVEMLRAEFPTVALIVNDRIRGFGANHNQVLSRVLTRASDQDYALVLNDDTALHARAVSELVACARRDETVGAFSPTLLTRDGAVEPSSFHSASQTAWLASALTGWSRPYGQPAEPDWLNGCCLLLGVVVLRRVGIFDERFYMFSEDVDLTVRIRTAGYRLGVCEASRIVHYGHGTVSRPSMSESMQRQQARSYHLFLRKHRGRAVAAGVSTALRCIHALRGAAALGEGVLKRDRARRGAGRMRLSLARYSPRRAAFPDREPSPTRDAMG